MKLCNNALRSVTGTVISIAFLSGCAINMKVPIKDPASSTGTYDKTNAIPETALLFKDEQSESDKAQILSGTDTTGL